MSTPTDRPILQLPRSPLEWSLEAVAAVGLILGCALILFQWSALPERIPTHFGFDGQPDSWGARASLWILPAVSAGIYLLITVISFFPHRFNYLRTITPDNAARHYRLARTLLGWIKAEIVCLFAWLGWQICQIGLEQRSSLSSAFLPLILGGLMMTIVVYLVMAGRKQN